jgi:hypothetical protein
MPKKEKINSNMIKIEQIIIHLDTSIPNKEAKSVGGADDVQAPVQQPPPSSSTESDAFTERKMIQLTSKILYHPQLKIVGVLSELPYITSSMKYPVNYLKGFFADDKNPKITDYNKIVEFFFNRNVFKKQLGYFSQNLAAQQNDKEREEENRKKEEEKNKDNKMVGSKSLDEREKENKKKILNFNIQYMLQMLFPTKFPTSINFSFSFEEYIEGKMVQTPHSVPIDYSYLKIDDKVYTVIKVTVLNDMVNNPLYREIIEIYNNFTIKNEQVSKQNETDIQKMNKNIYTKMHENDKNKTEYYNLKDIFKTFTYTNESFRDFFDLSGSLTINDIKKIIDGNKNDFDKITIDKKKIENTILKLEKNSKYYESLKDLYTNYKTVHNNIEEIYNLLKKEISLEDSTFTNDMKKVLVLMEGIKKSMGIISKNQSITNETTITDVNSKLFEEVKQLNDLIKINNDFNKENPKINLDKETSDIKETLTKKNPLFAKFVEKIKNVIDQHKTNNEELLDILKNFYNSKDPTDIKTFNDLNKSIIVELLNHSSQKIMITQSNKFFEKKENQKKINTGVHYINQNNDKLPQYEIYVAVDLFEGEINDSNVNKCNYRAFYLGQESENIFDGLNYIYDINFHRLFIPGGFEKEVVDVNSGKDDVSQLIPTEKKGGKRRKMTLKLQNKKRNHRRRRTRKICSPFFNKKCKYH